jgi:putative oxidoreductase
MAIDRWRPFGTLMDRDPFRDIQHEMNRLFDRFLGRPLAPASGMDRQPWVPLPLRIVLGCSFVVLGLQKLGGYFDGAGLARTGELMATGGLTPGTFWAWIVGVLELLGGAAIVLGLLTRGVALVLALESLVATIAGWQLTNVEFRLAALAAFVALALLGPQRYALDLKSLRLASWSRLGDTRGSASKAA